MQHFITPTSMAEFLVNEHPNKADLQEAMSYLPEMEAQLPPPTGKQPVLVHMLGGPGSGKSMMATRLLQRLEQAGQTFHRHAHDHVMESLPPYRIDLDRMGAETAFKRWEVPARATAFALLARIITRQVSIVYDNGGADRRHINMLQGIQQQGYRVLMVNPVVTLETALQRVTLRMQKPGTRHTSEHMVRDRYAVLAKLVAEYTKQFEVIQVDNNDTLDEKSLAAITTRIVG